MGGREDKIRQDKTRQDKTRQDKTRQKIKNAKGKEEEKIRDVMKMRGIAGGMKENYLQINYSHEEK